MCYQGGADLAVRNGLLRTWKAWVWWCVLFQGLGGDGAEVQRFLDWFAIRDEGVPLLANALDGDKDVANWNVEEDW